MALAYSDMMELGAQVPDFKLFDTISEKEITLSQYKSEVATVIVFICNHCPFVHHINSKLVEVATKYQLKGIQFIAISSNDIVSHPQDSPEHMKLTAEKENYSFPYLFDATQKVAKAYKAECTPDFFVADKDLKCVYRGRFDETRPNLGQSTGKDLSNALDAIISNKEVNIKQEPSMGCGIKWKLK